MKQSYHSTNFVGTQNQASSSNNKPTTKRPRDAYENCDAKNTNENSYSLPHNSVKYQSPTKKHHYSNNQQMAAVALPYTGAPNQIFNVLPLNIQNGLLALHNGALFGELLNQQNIVNQYSVYLAAQNRRIQDLETKLAREKSKNKEEKQEIKILEERNKQQGTLIDEYIKIKGELAEQLLKYEQKSPPVTKLNVLKSLEKILLTEISRNILVDFIIEEGSKDNLLNQIGRVEVDGRKQHRHIIPHALLSKAVKNAITSKKTANELLTNLSEIIASIFTFEKNICLREEDYKKLKLDQDIHFDEIITTSNTYYFINAKQHDVIFDDLNITQDDAENLYKEKYKKFIIHDLKKLALSAEGDANTITMISELLIKFIYTIFNQNSVVSYPDAGNSRNYEIRLYKNATEAKNPKNKEYEVLIHSEINEYFAEDKQHEIADRIRIVNNEGSNVKKSIKAFELFSQIIDWDRDARDNKDIIDKYNKSYNKILKLENSSIALTKYNQDLVKDQIETQLVFHIVKYLFFILDLKPLEPMVFASSENQQGIQVFDNATTKIFSYYNIFDGQNFRDIERKSHKDKIPCRTETIDKKVLALKIDNEINLLKFSNPSFTDAFDKPNFCDNVLEESFNLYSLVYNIDFKKEDYIEESQPKIIGEDSMIVESYG